MTAHSATPPRRAGNLVALACTVALCAGLAGEAGAASTRSARTFASTEAAVTALIAAVESGRPSDIDAVLGAGARNWVRSGDAAADAEALSRFIAAYRTQHAFEDAGPDRTTLVVGTDRWPMPIPLVKTRNGWRFDAIAGREEMLARRVGRNELSAIEVLRAIVDAEHEYAVADRDGDGLLEYAGRFASHPGRQDGLYWETAPGEPPSPLGPLVAEAAGEGYRVGQRGKAGTPPPFHGYHFRLLGSQGPSAPGGAYDYVVNGQQIGGFAVVAWPANYGNSGVMSFLVNHDGRVLQKDLGPDTARLARRMTRYNPDASWKPADTPPLPATAAGG